MLPLPRLPPHHMSKIYEVQRVWELARSFIPCFHLCQPFNVISRSQISHACRIAFFLEYLGYSQPAGTCTRSSSFSASFPDFSSTNSTSPFKIYELPPPKHKCSHCCYVCFSRLSFYGHLPDMTRVLLHHYHICTHPSLPKPSEVH